MNNEQFKKLVAEVMRTELDTPEQWHYLSFAAEGEGFKGAAIIQGHGLTDSLMRCNLLGLNPGGEVMCVPMPANLVPAESYRNRLLSKADILELWPEAKSIREWEAEEDQGTPG